MIAILAADLLIDAVQRCIGLLDAGIGLLVDDNNPVPCTPAGMATTAMAAKPLPIRFFNGMVFMGDIRL